MVKGSARIVKHCVHYNLHFPQSSIFLNSWKIATDNSLNILSQRQWKELQQWMHGLLYWFIHRSDLIILETSVAQLTVFQYARKVKVGGQWTQFGFKLKSLLDEPQAPCTYYICVPSFLVLVYVYMHKLVCMCACMTCESGLEFGLRIIHSWCCACM